MGGGGEGRVGLELGMFEERVILDVGKRWKHGGQIVSDDWLSRAWLVILEISIC